MLLRTFKVWVNTFLLWLLQSGVYSTRSFISGRIIESILVSLRVSIPSQGLSESRILHNSSLIRSLLIFLISWTLSLIASYVLDSIEKPNWALNRMALSILRASSLKRLLGSPTALITLFFKSSMPLK